MMEEEGARCRSQHAFLVGAGKKRTQGRVKGLGFFSVMLQEEEHNHKECRFALNSHSQIHFLTYSPDQGLRRSSVTGGDSRRD